MPEKQDVGKRTEKTGRKASETAEQDKTLTADEKMDLLRVLVDNVAEDFSEEDILHMMLEKKISVDLERSLHAATTFGQRTADRIARFAGSWGFIFSFTALLLFWMFGNNLLEDSAFDAYPYILLNLVLSCVAAVQAPLIMMSQNRREERDREQAENAYKVNLKSEFILEDLHKKMDRILDGQERMSKEKKVEERIPEEEMCRMSEERVPRG